MDLEFNSLEEVPEAFRDGFVEHSGKFIPKRTAELLTETKDSLSKFHSTKSEYEKTLSQLEEYKKGEAERIKAAQQEAEERLRKEGKFDELIKLEQEKASNVKSEYQKQVEDWQNKYNELQSSVVQKDNASLARKIASQYAPSQMSEAVAELLISKRIKNVEGQSVFTNSSGEAMDLEDMEAVFKNLESDPFFSPFAAAPESRGGMGKGGSYRGDSKTISRKAFDALPAHEKAKVAREKQIVN